MPRKLIVEIVGDTRGLERSYKRGASSSKDFGRNLDKTVRGAIVGTGAFRSLGRSIAFASASFLGGAGLIAVTKSSIDAASNLAEQINKADVVFGKSASTVVEWSKDTARSMGIARDEALGFAGTFGNLLVPMGVTRGEAAKMSTSLVKLAADMASFNNANPADVLDALKGALAGQVRPLRQYGVFLSDARIKAEALSGGIVRLAKDSTSVRIAEEQLALAESRAADQRAKNGSRSREYAAAQLAVERASQRVAKASKGTLPQLTDQQKLLARLRIVYKDTGDAQGDFGRTLGTSLANQLRVFRAQVRDLQADLGQILLPAVSKVVKAFNEWLGKGDNKARLVEQMKRGVQGLGAGLRTAWSLIRPLIRATQIVAEHLGGWRTALTLAIGAWAGFKVAGIASAAAVSAANLVAAGVVETAWRAALISTGWGALAAAAGAAAAYVITHWSKVKGFFAKLWLNIEGTFLTALEAILEPFSHLPNFLGGWARRAKVAVENELIGIEVKLQNLDTAARSLKQTVAYVAPGKFGPVITDAMKAAKAGAGGGAVKKGPLPKPTTFSTAQSWRDAFDKVLQRLEVSFGRAQLTASLQDDLRVLNQMQAAIEGQLRVHKGDLDLQQRLVSVQQQRKDLEQQITDAVKAQRQARQFRALGLTGTGDDVVPGVRALRGQLGRVGNVIEGTFLDTKKNRSVIQNIRRVLSGQLGLVGRDVRSKIHEILTDLDKQLRDHAGNATKFRHANTAALLAGLGLSPDEVRAVRARIATIGSGGVVPPRSSPAYALAGATYTGPIHVHGVQNPRQFEEHMDKRRRSRPTKRRGTGGV